MATTLRLCATMIFLLLIVPITFSQVAEKTLVKSFAVEPHQAIVVDVPGAVNVKTWENNVLRVQITIALNNGNEAILKSLVSAGRYNVIPKEENGVVTLVAPALEKEVQVGGKPLEDAVSIMIFAPQNVTVKIAGYANNTAINSSL